jgi:hypothetical protein
MAHTFHIGARIPHRFGTIHTAERSGCDCDGNCHIIADLISNNASPFKAEDTDSLSAMSTPTLRKLRDRYLAKPSATEEAFDHVHAARGTNASRDRYRAEDFAPMSTLVANAIRNGRDPAPILAMLAERARRARTAVAMAARLARPAGIPMNSHEQKRAQAFAPESSLDAWRRWKAR